MTPISPHSPPAIRKKVPALAAILPPEILLIIFSHLKETKEIINSMLVSRQWSLRGVEDYPDISKSVMESKMLMFLLL